MIQYSMDQATVSAPYGISVYDGVEEIDGQWYTKYIAGPVFTDNDEGTARRTRNLHGVLKSIVMSLNKADQFVRKFCHLLIGLYYQTVL